jgi:hypothetical protein
VEHRITRDIELPGNYVPLAINSSMHRAFGFRESNRIDPERMDGRNRTAQQWLRIKWWIILHLEILGKPRTRNPKMNCQRHALSLSLSLSLSCARARAHSRINRKTEAISRAAVANWPRLTRTFVLLCSDNISPLLPLPPSSIPVSLLHRCGMSGPPASSPEASRFSCAPSSS